MELNLLERALNNIDIEDLEYVELDLSFNELASMAFLLYGEERITAEFALQKLLVMSNAFNANQGNSAAASTVPHDLLTTYALKVNPTTWRGQVIEALSVINARRVLRKLGIKWESARQHYLPHITELSLHLQPLLKALFKICESLTPAQAGHLSLYIDHHYRPQQEHFRFYNSEILEVFLLDWITRRIISVGDQEANGADLKVLLEYFKLNELDDIRSILVNTLMNNSAEKNVQDSNSNRIEPPTLHNHTVMPKPDINQKTKSSEKEVQHQEFDKTEIDHDHDLAFRYNVKYESAGIVLIINEREFYTETDAQLQHLLPKEKLKIRKGTDVDKERLEETFTSFGYKAIVKENLKHTEILHEIGQCAQRSLFCDSFVVCILSHGFKGNVYGSNSIPVAISDIEEKFMDKTLERKPKFLIIQACQDKEADLKETERKKRFAIEYGDVLKAMATVPGFTSVRHKQHGTWFIQSLCKAIMQLSHKQHLVDILTAVTDEVSNKKGDKDEEVMMPQVLSTLRKKFYLPQRK